MYAAYKTNPVEEETLKRADAHIHHNNMETVDIVGKKLDTTDTTIYDTVEEECSIYLKLCPNTLANVKRFLKAHEIKLKPMKKILYKNDMRMTIDNRRITYERKTSIKRKMQSATILNHIFEVRRAINVETPINKHLKNDENFENGLFLCGFKSMDAKNVTHIIHRCFEYIGPIRISIDLNENFGQHYLHIEHETSDSIKKFRKTIEEHNTAGFFSNLFRAAFESNISVMELPASSLHYTRPFVYNKVVAELQSDQMKKTMYAGKLDGIRYVCFFTMGWRFAVPELNVEFKLKPTNNQIWQTFLGAVELIDTRVYLIDITAVINSVHVVYEINPIDACKYIQHYIKPNLDAHPIKTENGENAFSLHVNTYTKNKRQAEQIAQANPKLFDGIVAIEKHSIKKIKKENSVDVLFKKKKKDS